MESPWNNSRPILSCMNQQNRQNFSPIEREYTLSQINWKRSLTDVDMKRRKAAERERSRLTFDIIKQISNPTLRFEVEKFKLFGDLKSVNTNVHNTLPSIQTVAAEKDYIEFEKMRREKPHAVQYRDIYTSMKREADKPRTPCSRAVSQLSVKRDRSPYRSYSSQKSISPSSGVHYLKPGNQT